MRRTEQKLIQAEQEVRAAQTRLSEALKLREEARRVFVMDHGWERVPSPAPGVHLVTPRDSAPQVVPSTLACAVETIREQRGTP